MQHTKTSLRYAKALFQISKEKNTVQSVLWDVKNILKTISENPDLISLLKNPTIRFYKKSQVFEKIFKNKLNPITMGFLLLVLKKGRESFLDQIMEQYINLYHKDQEIVLAEIISFKPINSDLKENIKQKINSKGNVKLKEVVDKSILGGFIINIGDLQYDASIRKKINNVKRVFKL